jgi:hypothetical protein
MTTRTIDTGATHPARVAVLWSADRDLAAAAKELGAAFPVSRS